MQKRRRRRRKIQSACDSIVRTSPKQHLNPNPKNTNKHTQQSETHTHTHRKCADKITHHVHTSMPYNMHAYNVHLQIPYPPSEHRCYHTQKHYVTMLLHMCTRCPSVFLCVCCVCSICVRACLRVCVCVLGVAARCWKLSEVKESTHITQKHPSHTTTTTSTIRNTH